MVTVLALLSNSLRKEGNGSRSYLCEAQLRPGLPPPCSCLPALLRLRPGETAPCRNGQCRASIDCWAGGRSLCAEGVAWGGTVPCGPRGMGAVPPQSLAEECELGTWCG